MSHTYQVHISNAELELVKFEHTAKDRKFFTADIDKDNHLFCHDPSKARQLAALLLEGAEWLEKELEP